MQIRTRAERLGLRVAEVIDFVVDFGDAAARHAVVAASLAWGRAHGAHVVEWRGTHPAVPTLFAGGGWMRRASEINPFVCYSQRTDELDLPSRGDARLVEDLLRFAGFPDPFLAQSPRTCVAGRRRGSTGSSARTSGISSPSVTCPRSSCSPTSFPTGWGRCSRSTPCARTSR